MPLGTLGLFHVKTNQSVKHLHISRVAEEELLHEFSFHNIK